MATETKLEIITFFTALIGGTAIDADLSDSLLNHAKEIVEGDRPWAFLIKEDSSKTFVSGDTYLTQKDLPTDFLEDYKMFVGDSNSAQEYRAIAFYDRRKFMDAVERYYIDHAAGKFSICGKTSDTKNIYLFYVYQTPELVDDTDEPVWPIKFRKLLAFIMAQIYESGIDYDQITAQQAVSNNREAKMILDNMINWDAKIKLRQLNGRTDIVGQGGMPVSGRIDIDHD